MLAITLSRRDWREHDQIVSFYTDEKGKLDLIARGVKKIVSKNSAHLEPFSYIVFDSVQGRELSYLTSVQALATYSAIRADFKKSVAAATIVGILDKITHAGVPDKKLFLLIRSWLAHLNASSAWSPLVIDALVLQIFGHLGLCPEMSKCVVCGQEARIVIKENLIRLKTESVESGFYFAGGGFICPSCRAKKERAGVEIASCTLNEISHLQLLLKENWQLVNDFSYEGNEVRRVHELVYAFVSYHSDRPIGDWWQWLEP